MSTPPSLVFADDNSAARRAARRAAADEEARAARRQQIVEVLRRCRAEAGDPDLVDRRERERRHAELLERYPALY